MQPALKVIKEGPKVTRLSHISKVHEFLANVVKRDYDAPRLNRVANHPDVYRWVKGNFEGQMDLSPVVADQRNILIMGDKGGVLFVKHQPGLYEAHTQVLPEGRGEWTLNMVRAALQWLFTHTDAVEIITRVPKGNLGARALTRAIHGSFQFKKEQGWIVDNKVVPADTYSLTVQDWQRTAEGLTERGEWFHNRLEAEFQRVGFQEPPHPEDLVHDRYVGAAAEGILAGQPHKAVVLYNRWAAMAGYAPIHIVTHNPLVLDISNSLIMVRENDFWVMSACR